MTPVVEGEELTISYLGIFLFADTQTRRKLLHGTKFFACRCARCESTSDLCNRLPCPKCHKREAGKYLPQEVEWEEEPVAYVTDLGAGGQAASCCGKCATAAKASEPAVVLGRKTADKIAERLLRRTAADIDCEEDQLEQDDLDRQLLGLASSIVGAKHWTTNLLGLLLLDRQLADFNRMLLVGENPDMVELAEAIDTLDRLWAYAGGLDLGAHAPERLLHRQAISVARALVARGDSKSKKFGSQWAAKVKVWCDLYEGPEYSKVCDNLATAGNEGDAAKKQRTK